MEVLMKIKRGSTRVAIICGGFAFKFCRISPLLNIVKRGVKLLFRNKLSSLPLYAGMRWNYFTRGLKANIYEYQCWKTTKASFLVRTYASFYFLNIQKEECGQELTQKEMSELVDAIGHKTKNIDYVDPHCFAPDNFVKNDRGYRMVDYGDRNSGTLSLNEFIKQSQREIASVLCNPKPPLD